MLKDDIRYALAHKQVNIGIAIGAGADVAVEVAEVTLVGGELRKVLSLSIDSKRQCSGLSTFASQRSSIVFGLTTNDKPQSHIEISFKPILDSRMR